MPILKVVPEAMSFFVNFYCEVTTSTTTTHKQQPGAQCPISFYKCQISRLHWRLCHFVDFYCEVTTSTTTTKAPRTWSPISFFKCQISKLRWRLCLFFVNFYCEVTNINHHHHHKSNTALSPNVFFEMPILKVVPEAMSFFCRFLVL
jgi:hypothetical protein